ncbi:MAG: hypothetical protein D6800_09670 [Candidatus Zixiibacteriota bacterium]|nr:MAG: hypothetical protein D6800_09670 [candidate division Zixibacteria bacterium]
MAGAPKSAKQQIQQLERTFAIRIEDRISCEHAASAQVETALRSQDFFLLDNDLKQRIDSATLEALRSAEALRGEFGEALRNELSRKFFFLPAAANDWEMADVESHCALYGHLSYDIEFRYIQRHEEPYDNQLERHGDEALWDTPTGRRPYEKLDIHWIRRGSTSSVDCDRCNASGRILCPVCDGSKEKLVKCAACAGRGVVKLKTKARTEGGKTRVTEREEQCKRCNARGRLKESCKECNGTGRVTCASCKGRRKLFRYETIHVISKEMRTTFLFSSVDGIRPRMLRNALRERAFEYDDVVKGQGEEAAADESWKPFYEKYTIAAIPIVVATRPGKKGRVIFVDGTLATAAHGALYDKVRICLWIIGAAGLLGICGLVAADAMTHGGSVLQTLADVTNFWKALMKWP